MNEPLSNGRVFAPLPDQRFCPLRGFVAAGHEAFCPTDLLETPFWSNVATVQCTGRFQELVSTLHAQPVLSAVLRIYQIQESLIPSDLPEAFGGEQWLTVSAAHLPAIMKELCDGQDSQGDDCLSFGIVIANAAGVLYKIFCSLHEQTLLCDALPLSLDHSYTRGEYLITFGQQHRPEQN
jgi:hypothetical protein